MFNQALLLILLALPAGARQFSDHTAAIKAKTRLTRDIRLQKIIFAPSGRHVIVNDALLRRGDPFVVVGLPKHVYVARIGHGIVAFEYDGFTFHKRLPRSNPIAKLLPTLKQRAWLKVKRILYRIGIGEPKKRLRMALEDTFGWSPVDATKFAVREAPRL
jgi:hypothetical protein